ncbi:hypothetical protein NHX12_015937 [Muraenolepis orangiensis]|uniref:Reverse transcriptase domain-containing protein n=1 Tax=Muraenolepis orangiensis TaxID=630683 RepID=A0A9Q0DBQ7_9TELE|nr:hypothetical protein NHX12_015937 [Muraenolepis orangiensis]
MPPVQTTPIDTGSPQPILVAGSRSPTSDLQPLTPVLTPSTPKPSRFSLGGNLARVPFGLSTSASASTPPPPPRTDNAVLGVSTQIEISRGGNKPPNPVTFSAEIHPCPLSPPLKSPPLSTSISIPPSHQAPSSSLPSPPPLTFFSPSRPSEDNQPRSPSYYQPRIHPHTNRKATMWSLPIRKPIIIMGDSNIARIPKFKQDGIQADSFPGATLRHLTAILLRLTSPRPDTKAASVNANLSGDFTPAELKDVMAKLKQGKAPGSDNIHPEFVTHQCEITSAWLCAFFSACLRRSKLPRTWRRAAVIALLKPNKPADDPKSYRPISLLCVPFKILERMIHSRIEPVVDSQLPKEQAGFRRGRSTVDQVTLLTQDLEDSFQAKAKAGVVLLDLTAAYDTVWHRGLHLKLLRTIPDRHMVNFIMEMLSNRSFILQTSDGQRSRLRRLRNGVPQGSVLSPMLFNIYIFDLPVTTSRRYGYADDLAIMLHQPTWKAVEEGLNQDMDVLAAYLRSWRLQLSTGKTVSAVFHLCNREARRELEISVENKPLEFQQAPKYLGVRLDRTLSYKQHLDEVRAKVTARVSLIRRLAGTTWGASAKGEPTWWLCGLCMDEQMVRGEKE